MNLRVVRFRNAYIRPHRLGSVLEVAAIILVTHCLLLRGRMRLAGAGVDHHQLLPPALVPVRSAA
jgi:hypothetical protein